MLVAFGIQHAMRHVILSYVACPALQCFCTLCHKRHVFRGGGVKEGEGAEFVKRKMCVLQFHHPRCDLCINRWEVGLSKHNCRRILFIELRT
jgi:hypothetical protein